MIEKTVENEEIQKKPTSRVVVIKNYATQTSSYKDRKPNLEESKMRSGRSSTAALEDNYNSDTQIRTPISQTLVGVALPKIDIKKVNE